MNEITEPHPLSEGWTIDVTHLELMRVLTFARSRVQIHDDSVVWVRQNGIASRRWLVGGERFWMWVDTTGGTADPAVPVAIPVPFLDEVSEIAEEFGKATIFRNADDGRFTAYFADEHLWWDSIEDHPTEWMHEDEVCFDQPVTAAVDFAAVERIVSAYNTNLGGMSHGGPGQLPPFITMRIGDGRLHWTTSWARFGLPDVSGATSAETTGEGMVAFFPGDMFRAVRALPTVGEVRLRWESSSAAEVCLCDEDWGIVCDITDELIHRVHRDLVTAFALREWEPSFDDGLRLGRLEFRDSNDRIALATVVEGAEGRPDWIRLSMRVATVEGDPGAAHEHVNALNGKLAGAKVIQDGTGVFVCVEFAAPAEFTQIESQIDELCRNAAECDGLDQFLPLFSLPTTDG